MSIRFRLSTFSPDYRNALLVVLAGILVVVAAVAYRFLDRELTRRADAPLSVISERGGMDTFTDLSGNQVALGRYIGNHVAIVTWATWCPSCQAQLEIVREVTEARGIETLALNRMEPRATIESYIAVYGAVGGLTYLIDTKDLFHQTTEGFTVPEFLLFNGTGEIIVHTRGEQTKEELSGAIDTALKD